MENIQVLLNKINQSLPDQQQKEYYSIHIDRYKNIIENIIKLNIPPKSLALDIGCYPPHMFDILSNLNFITYGISSSHEKVRRPNVSMLNIESDKLPYPDNSINLVLFSEVLEHLTIYPDHLFNEIRRILSTNGYLIITTPNVIRSQNLIKILFGQNIYYPIFQLKENIYHRHNREYTKNEIEELLNQHGFNIYKSDYLISYTPFRQKNHKDKLILKLIKIINYLHMSLFNYRRDTIILIATKN